MKNVIFYLLIGIFSLQSCEVTVYPYLVDGDPTRGTLTFAYQYSALTIPVIAWEPTREKALAKCQSWGFKKAEFFEGGISNCISFSEGDCNTWQVMLKCVCTNDP